MHPETEQAYKIHWNNGKWLAAQDRLRRVVLKVHGEKVSPHANQPGGFNSSIPSTAQKHAAIRSAWTSACDLHKAVLQMNLNNSAMSTEPHLNLAKSVLSFK